MALQDLSEGASIDDLEKAIAYYEALEDYEACEGILRAVKEVKENTINAIKLKIDEIRNDTRNSRKGNRDKTND
jgi:hypothetical protein